MSEQHFRESHQTLPPATLAKRKKSRKVAVSVAITAIGSVLFGVSNSQPPAAPQFEKQPKHKAGSSQATSEHHPTAPVLSDKYTVLAGDTVRSIAQLHSVSSAELLAANGLSWKTMIFAGQQLHIPAQSNGTESADIGESVTRHIVVAGDTLEAISRSFGVQPKAIMTANGLDRSSRLVVGQKLLIPDAHVMSSLPATLSA